MRVVSVTSEIVVCGDRLRRGYEDKNFYCFVHSYGRSAYANAGTRLGPRHKDVE